MAKNEVDPDAASHTENVTGISVDTPDVSRYTDQKTFWGQTKGDWYIYWICAVASIANVFGGFDNGIYSIIIANKAFIDEFNATDTRAGVIASMATLGCILGNWFVSWWFLWYLGRTKSFAAAAVVVIVGVAMQAGAHSFALIVVGRIIAGIGSVLTGTNQAMYQAEVSSPKVRGRVVSLVQLSYQVGALIAYCVGLGTEKIHGQMAWRTATALQIVPGIILILVSFTIPESPRWMLERHPEKPERALRLLAKVRCLPETDPEVQAEYKDLVSAHQYRMEYEGTITWKKFLTSYAIWKRLAYGMSTMALGQITGVGALMLYGVLIYQGLGFSGSTESLLLNVVSGLLCLLATAFIMSGVDKWGRKPTLIGGGITMVISYTVIAALADAYPTATNFNRVASGFQVAFIYIIQMAYSGALGPCAWIYACEIFPTHLRDKGVNLSQSGQMLTVLWIQQAWPTMFDNVGHNAYWILLGINFIGLIVVIFFWPETKGISLEHMDKIFGETDKVEAWHGELEKKRAVGEPTTAEKAGADMV